MADAVSPARQRDREAKPSPAAAGIAKLLTPARHRHESASGGATADLVNSEAAIYAKRQLEAVRRH
jgi:hypothetical protein